MVERLEELCIKAIRSNALDTLLMVDYDIGTLVDEYKTCIAAGITDTKTLKKVEKQTMQNSNEDILPWTWYLWYMALCRDFGPPTHKEILEIKKIKVFDDTRKLPYVTNQIQKNREKFRVGDWRIVYQQREQKRRAGQLVVKKDADRLNTTLMNDQSNRSIRATSIKPVPGSGGSGSQWFRNVSTPVTARGRIMKKIGMKRRF
eukprot:TRINITY_DN7256_c0_g1_i10.p3 TRINITY_DN7256_c0_g1~~TRINITY_DN7256_c0_g1_i10.p3  ORF type:complete len:203 (+),score=29.73 TRINITY_DN7256_c0_g1_i10:143-751(+)